MRVNDLPKDHGGDMAELQASILLSPAADPIDDIPRAHTLMSQRRTPTRIFKEASWDISHYVEILKERENTYFKKK